MFPFCEHPELSLANFGVPYNSLRVPDHVQPIPMELLHQILDAVSLSYNLDDDALGESWGPDSKHCQGLEEDEEVSTREYSGALPHGRN